MAGQTWLSGGAQTCVTTPGRAGVCRDLKGARERLDVCSEEGHGGRALRGSRPNVAQTHVCAHARKYLCSTKHVTYATLTVWDSACLFVCFS